MQVLFIAQPFEGGATTGHYLNAILQDTAYNDFRVAVAWAKRSGLSRMSGQLADFNARPGCTSELILGIDERGATWEGLDLARESFTHTYIYHDPGSRTFHPKLYLATGEQGGKAAAIVGSSNVTKGGLFTNYECGVVLLDLQDDPDTLERIQSYFASLHAQANACRLLTDDLMSELRQSYSDRIFTEGTKSPRPKSERQTTGSFGSPVQGLASAPPATARPKRRRTRRGVTYNAQPAGRSTVMHAPPPPSSGPGFWKRLSSFDVSRTSAPGQILIPKQYAAFFGRLTVQFDNKTDGGARQSQRLFSLQFHDGNFMKTVDDARVILYEPAEDHPRPNVELRFAFRDRDVFDRLQKDDVLEFRHHANGIRVTRVSPAPNDIGKKRWGTIR